MAILLKCLLIGDPQPSHPNYSVLVWTGAGEVCPAWEAGRGGGNGERSMYD